MELDEQINAAMAEVQRVLPGMEMTAAQWWQEEDGQEFDLGCPDYLARPALIYAVTACRLINAQCYDEADELLRLASAEVRALPRVPIW